MTVWLPVNIVTSCNLYYVSKNVVIELVITVILTVFRLEVVSGNYNYKKK